MAQNGKNENGMKVGQKKVFRLIGIENHRKITSKQGSNLKSLEAEITKRQKEGITGVANQSWTELGPAQPQIVSLFFRV